MCYGQITKRGHMVISPPVSSRSKCRWIIHTHTFARVGRFNSFYTVVGSFPQTSGEFFVGFLSTFRQTPGQCLKLRHHRFLPQLFQFIKGTERSYSIPLKHITMAQSSGHVAASYSKSPADKTAILASFSGKPVITRVLTCTFGRIAFCQNADGRSGFLH
jgi:hypothetical protein